MQAIVGSYNIPDESGKYGTSGAVQYQYDGPTGKPAYKDLEYRRGAHTKLRAQRIYGERVDGKLVPLYNENGLIVGVLKEAKQSDYEDQKPLEKPEEVDDTLPFDDPPEEVQPEDIPI